MARRVRRAAFTLVELIAVVIIIGVLAAIAIPRLSRGSADSAQHATYRDMKTIQTQIDLYAAEHLGVFPANRSDGANAAHTEAAFLSQLKRYTDEQGLAAGAYSSQFRFGPYLRKDLPALKIGPNAGGNKVFVTTGASSLSHQSTAKIGWLYNDSTGEFIPNTADGMKDLSADATTLRQIR